MRDLKGNLFDLVLNGGMPESTWDDKWKIIINHLVINQGEVPNVHA